MLYRLLTTLFTMVFMASGYATTPLDTFEQKSQLLKSQQAHLKKGEFDKYFGKRAFALALGSVEENAELERLAIELSLLDIIAFSKICDFSMASQSIDQMKQMELASIDIKGLSLAKEFFELRKKLYPKAARRAKKETKKKRIHWKVPRSYLAKVSNLDLLRVKVEDKCE